MWYATGKGNTMKTWRAAAPARQLDFTYHGARLPAARRVTRPRPGAARLCAVCGRLPAHLALERPRGGRPARVCLRCHQAALRQRRPARPAPARDATRQAAAGRTDLIVPRESGLPLEAKYRLLSRSRREAQEVARRALASD